MSRQQKRVFCLLRTKVAWPHPAPGNLWEKQAKAQPSTRMSFKESWLQMNRPWGGGKTKHYKLPTPGIHNNLLMAINVAISHSCLDCTSVLFSGSPSALWLERLVSYNLGLWLILLLDFPLDFPGSQHFQTSHTHSTRKTENINSTRML